MVRLLRFLVVCVAVACLMLASGCSMRHPTLLAETDMAQARTDSISLATFLELPESEQAARRDRVEAALTPVNAVEAEQSRTEQFLSLPVTALPYRTFSTMPALGDLLEHLDVAVGLDPTRADLWLLRGRMLDLAGDETRARVSLATAWDVLDRLPDPPPDERPLRRDVAVARAWIERDTGFWDEGLRWIDRAAPFAAADDAEAVLLRGLLLAGRGDLEDAMRLSYGMPALTLPAVCELGYDGFLGQKKILNDMPRRWLQAEVWMRRGRPKLAWRVLGEIPYWRRMVVLPHRLYQDLGLYAEMSGMPYRANLYYALAYVRREYRRSTMPEPRGCDPVMLGVPHREQFFFRLESGGYHGGSLLAYAFSTAMLAMAGPEGDEGADHAYLLATDALERCLRRGIQPDEALAMRGRLRFSRGFYVLAELDLAEARQRFATREVVEPFTSYLLGLISVGRDRPDEARPLLEEAVAADASLTGAWNALGVVRLQLGDREGGRAAIDAALASDPTDATAWFNRGLLRCQEGDLDGGLPDLERAADLAPEQQQAGRIIQLARLAQRRGETFLPGLDAFGRWTPAGVEVHAHEDGAFAPGSVGTPSSWEARLADLIDDALAEGGLQMRADGLDAAALADLEQAYRVEPTPERRKLLAHAFVWLDLPDEARSLLATYWGQDLDPDEVLLLLWLDQRAGEDRRAREFAAQLDADWAREVGSFDWRGLWVLLGGGRNPRSSPTGWAEKNQARNRSMSMGGREFGIWLRVQGVLAAHGVDAEDGLRQSWRGRAYRLGRGGSSPGGASTNTARVSKGKLR
jgi:tetratricopeptide (TPR) repeat protein